MREVRRDNFIAAIGSIVFAVLALSLGDALIKGFSLQFSLAQLFLLRSLMVLPLLFLVAKVGKQSIRLQKKDLGYVVLRSVLLTTMWVVYYISLPHIPLSVAAAIYYTIPLFITLLAAIFVKEKVGVLACFAIVLGFVGVLVIVRPDTDNFNLYVLLPLIAALFYACAMLLTRTKCQETAPLALALVLNVVFILFGCLLSLVIWLWQPSTQAVAKNMFLFSSWSSMAPVAIGVMVLLALIFAIGNIFTAIAYQRAPSSVVATFDYAYLAFSVFWGVLFFSEVPDSMTIVGIVMIAVAGLIVVGSRR